MAGLLEIVVILWKSIHRSMENNKEARVYTINKFASVLPEYLEVFKVRLAALVSRLGEMAPCSLQKYPHSFLSVPGSSSVAGEAEPALALQASQPRPSQGSGTWLFQGPVPAPREVLGELSGFLSLIVWDTILESSLTCWELRKRSLWTSRYTSTEVLGQF